MNPEMISNVLDKLSKKTGREWTFSDLLTLANKLPELKEQGMDAVFDELASMGLELSDDAKKKVAARLQEGTLEKVEEDIDDLSLNVSKKGSGKLRPKSSKRKKPNGARLLQQQLRKKSKPTNKKKSR